MELDHRSTPTDLDTTRGTPALPRQYVAKQEVRATRKPRKRSVAPIALLVPTLAAVGLLVAALSGGQAGENAPAVSAADSSAVLPIEFAGWRLDGLVTGLETATGEFEGTAAITWTGADAVAQPQYFTITAFRDGRKVGSLIGSVPQAIPGRTQLVEFGSTNAFAGGAKTYAFRTGR